MPEPSRVGRFLIILCLFANLNLSFPATAKAASLTLAEAVQLAVSHDPKTQDSRARIDIGKLKKREAWQKFLPKLDVETVTGPQVDYFGEPIVDQNLHYTSAGVEQPLYTGGVLKNTLKMATSETHRHEWQFRVRKLEVAVEAVQAYYQALTTQATIGQYQALLRSGQQDLREARTRLAAGTATRAEILEFEVKLLETQQKLSKAQAGYQVALSALRKLTGLDEAAKLLLTQHYPLQDIKANLQHLLAEAQGQRPLLSYLREESKYQQFRVQVEKGKRLPQLSLVARYGWQAPQFLGERKDWLVLLKASISLGNTTLSYGEQRLKTFPNIYAYPNQVFTGARTFNFSVRSLKLSIFDGSSNRVQLEEARADRKLAQDRLKESQRQTYYDVKDAWAQKRDSEARLATAQKQISLAQDLVKINQTKYGLGLTTLVEVFKARAALAEAKVSFVTAKDDRAIALGKLYRAVGRDLVFQGR